MPLSLAIDVSVLLIGLEVTKNPYNENLCSCYMILAEIKEQQLFEQVSLS